MDPKSPSAARRKERLAEELERLVSELKGLGVQKIILFGSLASGEVGRGSDIDLIIVRETDKRFLDRLEEIYSLLEPKVAVDVLVYTPDEFAWMSRASPFIRKALRSGRVLYDATESEG